MHSVSFGNAEEAPPAGITEETSFSEPNFEVVASFEPEQVQMDHVRESPEEKNEINWLPILENDKMRDSLRRALERFENVPEEQAETDEAEIDTEKDAENDTEIDAVVDTEKDTEVDNETN